jgi:hypothetical protein
MHSKFQSKVFSERPLGKYKYKWKDIIEIELREVVRHQAYRLKSFKIQNELHLCIS